MFNCRTIKQRQRQVAHWEFEASLVYLVSSRTARATQSPVSGKTNVHILERDVSAVKSTGCSAEAPGSMANTHTHKVKINK